MKQTIRMNGKKHSILKSFEKLYQRLSNINGIESVGTGRFSAVKNPEKSEGVKIQYYNPTTRIFKVRAIKGNERQYFYAKAEAGKEDLSKKGIESLIG